MHNIAANAKAVETVTLSSPCRRGAEIGMSSPASTNMPSTQNRVVVSRCPPELHASAPSERTAAIAVSAVKRTKRRGTVRTGTAPPAASWLMAVPRSGVGLAQPTLRPVPPPAGRPYAGGQASGVAIIATPFEFAIPTASG